MEKASKASVTPAKDAGELRIKVGHLHTSTLIYPDKWEGWCNGFRFSCSIAYEPLAGVIGLDSLTIYARGETDLIRVGQLRAISPEQILDAISLFDEGAVVEQVHVTIPVREGRELSGEFLASLQPYYSRAHVWGWNVAAYIAEKLDVSPSTALHWINQGKERGIIVQGFGTEENYAGYLEWQAEVARGK
jgi:hypothetical protein